MLKSHAFRASVKIETANIEVAQTRILHIAQRREDVEQFEIGIETDR